MAEWPAAIFLQDIVPKRMPLSELIKRLRDTEQRQNGTGAPLHKQTLPDAIVDSLRLLRMVHVIGFDRRTLLSGMPEMGDSRRGDMLLFACAGSALKPATALANGNTAPAQQQPQAAPMQQDTKQPMAPAQASLPQKPAMQPYVQVQPQHAALQQQQPPPPFAQVRE